jgi:DNA-directed RNA polymerase alpha subunit
MPPTRMLIPPSDVAAMKETSLKKCLDTPLAELLDQRTVNVLEEELNVLYVKDLVSMSRAEILRLPNVGPNTLETIVERLDDLGLTLAPGS